MRNQNTTNSFNGLRRRALWKQMCCATSIFAACFVGATTANAQSADIRSKLQSAGDCLIEQHYGRALESFNTPVSGQDYRKANADLIDWLGQCLGNEGIGSAVLSPWEIDQIEADSLVRRIYRDQVPGDLSLVGSKSPEKILDAVIIPPNLGKKERTNHYKTLIGDFPGLIFKMLAECVVRNNSSGSRALLLTKAGSKDEARDFSALAANFSECEPDGASYERKEFNVRGWLAMNYLKLAQIKGAM